jgi:putative ABC transport system substrate-binding protein
LITKQLQLLKEAMPSMSRIGLLHHQLSVSTIILDAADTAARRLGLTARTLRVAEPAEFEAAFRAARVENADAIQVLPSPVFSVQRQQLIELAARYHLPAMYEFKDYVQDGGLMSYGPSVVEMFRGMAAYVDRILRGANAGDLPIERASKFELVINLKTAKALGLTIPQSVLLRADELIQ